MGAAEFAVKLRAGSSSQMTSSWRKENAGDLDDDRRRRPHEKKGNPRKLPKVVRARQRKLRGF
jgi:hypothetical protein